MSKRLLQLLGVIRRPHCSLLRRLGAGAGAHRLPTRPRRPTKVSPTVPLSQPDGADQMLTTVEPTEVLTTVAPTEALTTVRRPRRRRPLR